MSGKSPSTPLRRRWEFSRLGKTGIGEAHSRECSASSSFSTTLVADTQSTPYTPQFCILA
jgi:hypothetical protein